MALTPVTVPCGIGPAIVRTVGEGLLEGGRSGVSAIRQDDGMNARVGGVIGALLCGTAACGAPDRLVPSVETNEGVSLATLASIPPADAPDHLWHLDPIRTVQISGPEGGDPALYLPTIVLSLSTGELFVHDDVQEGRLVLLDPETGAVLTRFGRTGNGPGELGAFLELSEGESGVLEVLDPRNRQLHTFSRSGEWLSSESIDLGGGRKARRHPHDPGFLLEAFRETEGAWYTVLIHWQPGASTPEPLLTLPEPDDGVAPGRIQGGRVLWTLAGENIVTMWSARPTMLVFGLDGKLRRRIDLPWTRREITDRDIQEQAEHYGFHASGLRPGPAALTNEMYTVNDTIVGLYQSVLWRPAEDPAIPFGAPIWRLFTVSGEYVGVLSLPRDFLPLGRTGNSLWISTSDDDARPVLQEVELARGGGP